MSVDWVAEGIGRSVAGVRSLDLCIAQLDFAG